jgi:uncharacterized membrane protein
VADTFLQPLAILQRGDVHQHLRREGLVDFPQRDIVVTQLVTREQTRDGEGRRHQ